ncbi:unnamed protein product, partial [Porites evermanni]
MVGISNVVSVLIALVFVSAWIAFVLVLFFPFWPGVSFCEVCSVVLHAIFFAGVNFFFTVPTRALRNGCATPRNLHAHKNFKNCPKQRSRIGHLRVEDRVLPGLPNPPDSKEAQLESETITPSTQDSDDEDRTPSETLSSTPALYSGSGNPEPKKAAASNGKPATAAKPRCETPAIKFLKKALHQTGPEQTKLMHTVSHTGKQLTIVSCTSILVDIYRQLLLNILRTLHNYVPYGGDGDDWQYGEQGIVGDQLSIEQAVNGHISLANGFTPEDRLEGLHFEVADWHAGNKFLEVSIQ